MKKIDRIAVVIARFGSDPEKIEIPKNSTVADALEEAEISIRSSEKVWINGDKAHLKDEVEEGDNILIVTPKEAGK